MSSLCANAGGRLIPISKTDSAAPITISLSYADDEPVRLVRLGVAIAVQVAQEVQAQFQNALSDAIFVTPFGDAPGRIQVTFVSNRECGGLNGFGVMEHYFDRRLKPGDANAPAIITIGTGSFRAFLTGMTISGSTSDAPVVQGTLNFTAWPLS